MCEKHQPDSTRRAFLQAAGTALLGLAGAGVPRFAAASASTERVLWLYNARTGESVAAPFTLDGKWIYKPGYYEICRILRDTHVPLSIGDVQFDVRAIEALYEVQEVLALVGVRRPISVYSGYRTQQTNASVEGAVYSYHMRAAAVDFGVEGVSMAYLWEVCSSRPIAGGIGYYADHIHVDSGPRRYWTA
jgi:uncharacterized protein YcbK (DUF882 family)